jgi:CheY-like chemotaxis protein
MRAVPPTVADAHVDEELTKPTVLCVDDDDGSRRLVRTLLGTFGCDCLTVASGPEALDIFQNGVNVDLVVTDFMMPEMDGHQLCRTIERDYPGMKVIVVSAAPPDELAPFYDSPNVHDVLPKPLHCGDFTSSVLTALQFG